MSGPTLPWSLMPRRMHAQCCPGVTSCGLILQNTLPADESDGVCGICADKIDRPDENVWDWCGLRCWDS